MLDLKATSGLPLQLADDGSLVFGAGVPTVEPAARSLAEMRQVLADPAASGPENLYYMYRDVARPEDREGLKAEDLR